MKKIIPVPVILIVAIVVCLAAFGIWRWTRSLPIEKVLPRDPVIYIRLSDLQKNWEAFARTEFWKKLSQISLRRFLAETGAPQRDLILFDSLTKNLSSPQTIRIFQELFGRDVAVAFYLPKDSDALDWSAREVFSRMALVTRLKPGRKGLELLIPMVAKDEKNISHSTVPYKNRDIHLITLKGTDLTLAFTRRADLLIIGISEQMPQRCLDLIDDIPGTLARDKNFQKIRSGYVPDTDLLGFINLGTLAARIKDYVIHRIAQRQKTDPDQIRSQMHKDINQMFGFQFLGFSFAPEPLYQAQVDLYYDSQQTDPRFFSVKDCKPVKNRNLIFIPNDVLTYQWNACYDFGYYWKKMQTGRLQNSPSPDKPDGSAAVSALEKKTGISIADDVIPLLGHEIGNAVFDIDTSGMFPVPQLFFLVKVKDVQAFKQILDRLSEQFQLIRLESRQHRETTIKYFQIPILAAFQPSYTFIDDYLLLATQSVLLEKCLDSQSPDAPALTENRFFQDKELRLRDPKNSFFYMNVSQFQGRLLKAIEWGDDWLSQKEAKREAFRKGQMRVLADLNKQIREDETLLARLLTELAASSSQKEEGLLLESQIRSLYGTIQEQEQSQVQEEMELPKGSLAELRQRLSQLEEQRDSLDPPLVEIRRMEAEVKRVEDQLETNREKASGVNETVQKFQDEQQMSPQKRGVLIKEYLRPFLRAFSHCEIFTSQWIFKDGLIESTINFKLQ